MKLRLPFPSHFPLGTGCLGVIREDEEEGLWSVPERKIVVALWSCPARETSVDEGVGGVYSREGANLGLHLGWMTSFESP